MWEKMNNFLDRTDLTARDEIIIAVITSIMMPGILAAFKALASPLIRKQISKIKEKKARKKRLKNNIFTLADIAYIQNKNKSKLKDYERRAIKKAENDIKELNKNRDEKLQIITESVNKLGDSS